MRNERKKSLANEHLLLLPTFYAHIYMYIPDWSCGFDAAVSARMWHMDGRLWCQDVRRTSV